MTKTEKCLIHRVAARVCKADRILELTKARASELREELKALDELEEVEVSNWEANFIDSVAYSRESTMSVKQRECAAKIVERYWRELL